MSRRRMNRKLNQIYKRAKKPENLIPLSLERDLFVIFSDHHKGDSSAADDFKKNASLYETALSFYKEKGFKLIVLGDNEELWENRYGKILSIYRDLIEKEIELAITTPHQEKIRVWGNHDKEVSLPRFKRFIKKQDNIFLKNVLHREGLCLGEDIFLVHGHQGRFFDDVAWRISRWAVQFLWKSIQKLFNIGIDGPSENIDIREDLELNYYQWAKEKKLMLVCGHTHRAIFGSLTHLDQHQIEMRHMEKILEQSPHDRKEKIEKEIEKIKAEKEDILARRGGRPPKSFEKSSETPVPCYFNDGCCCYTNGITCIEIDKGTIRLVKWQRQDAQREIFAEGAIPQILASIKESRPIDCALKAKEKRILP